MDSVQEQIVKKIAAALGSVASVQRFNQDGVDLATVPTIILKEGDVTIEAGEAVYPSICRKMELFAVIATRQDAVNDPRSGGEILNDLVAQLEMVLMTNRSWDGLAIETDSPTYFHHELDATTPHLSYGTTFKVKYEHLRMDPYNQAGPA